MVSRGPAKRREQGVGVYPEEELLLALRCSSVHRHLSPAYFPKALESDEAGTPEAVLGARGRP